MAQGHFNTGFTVAEVLQIQAKAKEFLMEGKTLMAWQDSGSTATKQFRLVLKVKRSVFGNVSASCNSVASSRCGSHPGSLIEGAACEGLSLERCSFFWGQAVHRETESQDKSRSQSASLTLGTRGEARWLPLPCFSNFKHLSLAQKCQ